MTTIELASTSKPGTTYTLVINNGRAVGCLNCDEKKRGEEKYGPTASCHHMRAYNAQPVQVKQHCVCCGRKLKGSSTICGRCVGY